MSFIEEKFWFEFGEMINKVRLFRYLKVTAAQKLTFLNKEKKDFYLHFL